MSVQSELTRLETAKAAIQTAIAGKGVTVPDGTLLDGMAALIESIETGGDGIQFGYQSCFEGTFCLESDSSSVTIRAPNKIDNNYYPAGIIIQALSNVGIGTSQSQRYVVLNCLFAHPTNAASSTQPFSGGFSMCSMSSNTSNYLTTNYYYSLDDHFANSKNYICNLVSYNNDNRVEIQAKCGSYTPKFKAGVIYKYAIFMGTK